MNGEARNGPPMPLAYEMQVNILYVSQLGCDPSHRLDGVRDGHRSPVELRRHGADAGDGSSADGPRRVRQLTGTAGDGGVVLYVPREKPKCMMLSCGSH